MTKDKVYKICILLFLLVFMVFMMLSCNSQTPGSGVKATRSVIDKGGGRIAGLEHAAVAEEDINQNIEDNLAVTYNLEPVIVDNELDALLDGFNMQVEEKKVIAHIQYVLCDATIVGMQGNANTYTPVEFRSMLNRLGEDDVKRLATQLLPILSEFRAVQSEIEKISDGAYRRGLLYRLGCIKRNYAFVLKEIFRNPVSKIYDAVVEHVNFKNQKVYYKNLEILKTDASGFVTLADRYSKFSDVGEAVKELRNIVTDLKIAVEQNYRTYSNEEFDTLLSSLDDKQLQKVILVYWGYKNRKDDIVSLIGLVDDVKEDSGALAPIRDGLKAGLSALKIEMNNELPEKLKDYSVRLKSLFDKRSAVALYRDISSIDDLSIKPYFDSYFPNLNTLLIAKSNFIYEYERLNPTQRRVIEWIKEVVFDPSVTVSSDDRKYTRDYEFYFLLGGNNSRFDNFIVEHSKVFERREEALSAINAFVDSKFKEDSRRDYHQVLADYKLYLRQLFNAVEADTFTFKFNSAEDKTDKNDYETKFAKIRDSVKTHNVS
ncbi:BTA121 domain-containing protein surface lipoprotein [Borrelia persica]|uniref:BTA121 domain-containing protein surface lipoprotein n=1 Tax=Borrelia persica TaxID=44448 RepID=UPI0004652BE8|nr:hypothetical protein [Borrelia persica]